MKPSSAALLMMLLLAGGMVRADSDKEERSRAHFEAGRVQYNLGDYKAAVREFAEGYRLVPRPQFLVNLGQAYRRLGQLERAREMYNRFLADTPPSDRARPQVHVLIAEIERELEKAQPEPAPEPESPPPVVAAPPEAPASPEPVVAATPAQTVAAAPKPAKPVGFWRRRWWIVPVIGVAVTGLVVGIVLGVRPTTADPDCAGSTFGCLNLKP